MCDTELFGVVTWVFFPVRREVRNWSSFSGKEKFRSFRYFAVPWQTASFTLEHIVNL
jgi:hypothetical protein